MNSISEIIRTHSLLSPMTGLKLWNMFLPYSCWTPRPLLVFCNICCLFLFSIVCALSSSHTYSIEEFINGFPISRLPFSISAKPFFAAFWLYQVCWNIYHTSGFKSAWLQVPPDAGSTQFCLLLFLKINHSLRRLLLSPSRHCLLCPLCLHLSIPLCLEEPFPSIRLFPI